MSEEENIESIFEFDGKVSILDSSLASQSNSLLEAQRDLSIRAKRVFLLILARINPLSEERQDTFLVTADDYANLSGTSKDSSYSTIKRASRELMKTIIETKDEKRKITCSKPFLLEIRRPSDLDPDAREGWVSLKVNDAFSDHLYDLSRIGYTKFNIQHVMKFRSMHSVRLFELVSMRKDTTKVTYITLPQLKEFLEIKPTAYDSFSAFKRKVLKPALAEINDNSDYNIRVVVHRKGLKVSRLDLILTLDSIEEVSEEELIEESKAREKRLLAKRERMDARIREKQEEASRAAFRLQIGQDDYLSKSEDKQARKELEKNGQQTIFGSKTKKE